MDRMEASKKMYASVNAARQRRLSFYTIHDDLLPLFVPFISAYSFVNNYRSLTVEEPSVTFRLSAVEPAADDPSDSTTHPSADPAVGASQSESLNADGPLSGTSNTSANRA